MHYLVNAIILVLAVLSITGSAQKKHQASKKRLRANHKPAQPKTFYFDIRMNSSPQAVDTYMYATEIYDKEDAYITSVELLDVNPNHNHHMILSSTGNGLVFVWAHRAPGFQFRSGTGMALNRGSTLNLVTHYLVPLRNSRSGFRLHLTTARPKFVVKSGGIEAPAPIVNIPPGLKHHSIPHQCMVRGGPAAINAVMVHAHSHGTQVTFKKSGKQTGGQKQVIQIGNPRNPQVFKYVNPAVVQTGDTLSLKCTYNTENEDRSVGYGVGRNEMCGVYYFYTGTAFYCA